MHINYRKNISLILAAAFIGFLVWSTIEFQHFFSKFLFIFQSLTEKNESLSILIFIGISALATMVSSFIRVLPVPIAIIIWGNVPAMLYLLAGWLIGDALSYIIGYSAGNPLVKKFVSLDKIDYYREKIPPRAQFRLILFFVIAMPAEIPNYVLGIIRYDFAKYFIATIFSEAIYTFLAVRTGQALVQQNFIFFATTVVLLVCIFSYAYHLFNKHLRQG